MVSGVQCINEVNHIGARLHVFVCTLIRRCYCTLLLLLLLFLAHQHKAAGRKTRIDIHNYGCNGNLLCDHCVVQSHGKALEKECCFPGVFCDSGDTPATVILKPTSTKPQVGKLY